MELSGLAVPDISVCVTSKSKEVFLWILGNHFIPSPNMLMRILF